MINDKCDGSRWWRITSPLGAHQRSSSIGGCPPLPGNSPFSSSWVLADNHTQEVQLKSAIYLYKPLGQHQLAININREGILKLMSTLPQPDNKMKRKEISTSNEMRSRLCLFIPMAKGRNIEQIYLQTWQSCQQILTCTNVLIQCIVCNVMFYKSWPAIPTISFERNPRGVINA